MIPFPVAGRWRVVAQLNVAGRLLTGAWNVEVQRATNADTTDAELLRGGICTLDTASNGDGTSDGGDDTPHVIDVGQREANQRLWASQHHSTAGGGVGSVVTLVVVCASALVLAVRNGCAKRALAAVSGG